MPCQHVPSTAHLPSEGRSELAGRKHARCDGRLCSEPARSFCKQPAGHAVTELCCASTVRRVVRHADAGARWVACLFRQILVACVCVDLGGAACVCVNLHTCNMYCMGEWGALSLSLCAHSCVLPACVCGCASVFGAVLMCIFAPCNRMPPSFAEHICKPHPFSHCVLRARPCTPHFSYWPFCKHKPLLQSHNVYATSQRYLPTIMPTRHLHLADYSLPSRQL